ncbi:Leucine-rich repeat (LRR) protein [Wenyingzhuangia heitensis]|uniref:Leucine-rich repeat (LRR) protein n=1 Tax=Wenyingzhuangia heitensis TaxID=1487859 RepID=A0ABX0UCA4_9FLAO|nr:leucine-rich repeat domain-containing protein [Wenyingzhuangia heitensis]NIJ44687.1 Leucine-rich repeat (LRR) protein [Wenyingzhuangia heitensis]
MKKNYFLLSFILVLFLMSCQTSKTFYGTTHFNLKETKNVYRLDLSEYQKEINLTRFLDLRMLNLSNIYDIKQLDQILKSIANPNQLRVLILNNNHLSILPRSIVRFKGLKQLSLQNNPELNLENSFKTLSCLSLDYLDLQYNRLTKIPPEIKLLKTLKEVNLSNNNLSNNNLFYNLCDLPALRSLWLRNNNISSLNTNLNKMDQLVNLYLENNQLKEIPSNLTGLKSLRVLHLSFNKFEELPENLQDIPKLILLHIDHCNIKSISKTFNSRTISVKGLVINNNDLSKEQINTWKSVFKNNFLLIF